MRPPVVWVLKAKMKWVIPLSTIAQPMKRVMPIPETDGIRMAKKPDQNEEDAEGDGPVDGFGGESGEGAGVSVHEVVLQKT